ncbi:hypothetical protein PM030_12355 [Halorubrum ezzemoulense]|uniref:hypothetical protein n=1 Tax=Halorubrum ezzemoulense TaxID=337243 RepID=UPI00232DEBC1|nr:hypothetical protein [Halorubrum ezzemoulense]MDB2282664.1 hypothetical protein [Halorubrum ezzemoulense]
MRLKNLINGIKRNWNRPYFYRMRFTEKVVAPVHKRSNSEAGIDIFSEDWDNLFILDACRLDLFEEVIGSTEIDGELSTRYSAGSGSVEFLKENFQGKDCRDTVYVTANPFVQTEIDTPFHAVEHVWRDGWDDELGTVRPETIAEVAESCAEEYPNKRLIVHFMQPHYPFIGNKRVKSADLAILRSKAQEKNTNNEGGNDVWARLSNGDVSKSEVWNAYRSNLELVLESVTDLITKIDGLSVISSDHGNALGERAWPIPISIYGHPNGVHINSLRMVPWFECRPSSRREITTGDEEESSDVNEDIDGRLEALGYK